MQELHEHMDIDALDAAILAEIQADGRISVAALADRIGLSQAPTYRRLRRLEGVGIVEGYHAKLEPKAVGLGIRALASVKFTTHELQLVEAFERFVLAEPCVLQCDNVTGEVDYMLTVTTRDLEEYERFTKRIRAVPGVASVHTHISLRRVKESFQLPLAVS